MSFFSFLDSIVTKKRLEKQLHCIHLTGLEPFEGFPASSLRSHELNEYVRRVGEEMGVHLQHKALILDLVVRAKYDAAQWAHKAAAEMIIVQHLVLETRSYAGTDYLEAILAETGRLICMLAGLLDITPDDLRKDPGVQKKLHQAGYTRLGC